MVQELGSGTIENEDVEKPGRNEQNYGAGAVAVVTVGWVGEGKRRDLEGGPVYWWKEELESCQLWFDDQEIGRAHV